MRCSRCGSELPNGTLTCTYCGAPVLSDDGAQQQQQAYQQPYQQTQGGYVNPSGYRTWAILMIIFGTWPFAIPALIQAIRIGRCNEAGDYEGAREAARKSRTWSIVSGAAAVLLYVLLFATGAAWELFY